MTASDVYGKIRAHRSAAPGRMAPRLTRGPPQAGARGRIQPSPSRKEPAPPQDELWETPPCAGSRARPRWAARADIDMRLTTLFVASSRSSVAINCSNAERASSVACRRLRRGHGRPNSSQRRTDHSPTGTAMVLRAAPGGRPRRKSASRPRSGRPVHGRSSCRCLRSPLKYGCPPDAGVDHASSAGRWHAAPGQVPVR